MFGSWLSGAFLLTSGVMGQKIGLSLLGTWRIPQLFLILHWEGTLVLFVCLFVLERFPVGFTDELISKVLPFRFNPVDH